MFEKLALGGVDITTSTVASNQLARGLRLFPGGPGNTFGNRRAFETIMRALDERLFVLPDRTHVYPGHGADPTIGTERPHVPEWRARGW